jgi:hypothetical protein
MKPNTTYINDWLDREIQKFQDRLEKLEKGDEEDDLDRLMDSEDHWQVMIDFTKAVKRRVAQINL